MPHTTPGGSSSGFKIADLPATITFNGQTLSRPEAVGSGVYGHAFLYRSDDGDVKACVKVIPELKGDRFQYYENTPAQEVAFARRMCPPGYDAGCYGHQRTKYTDRPNTDFLIMPYFGYCDASDVYSDRGFTTYQKLNMACMHLQEMARHHALGVIHFDAHASNFRVRDDSVALGIDYGLAKAVGAFVKSPQWSRKLPPETIVGSHGLTYNAHEGIPAAAPSMDVYHFCHDFLGWIYRGDISGIGESALRVIQAGVATDASRRPSVAALLEALSRSRLYAKSSGSYKLIADVAEASLRRAGVEPGKSFAVSCAEDHRVALKVLYLEKFGSLTVDSVSDLVTAEAEFEDDDEFGSRFIEKHYDLEAHALLYFLNIELTPTISEALKNSQFKNWLSFLYEILQEERVLPFLNQEFFERIARKPQYAFVFEEIVSLDSDDESVESGGTEEKLSSDDRCRNAATNQTLIYTHTTLYRLLARGLLGEGADTRERFERLIRGMPDLLVLIGRIMDVHGEDVFDSKSPVFFDKLLAANTVEVTERVVKVLNEEFVPLAFDLEYAFLSEHEQRLLLKILELYDFDANEVFLNAFFENFVFNPQFRPFANNLFLACDVNLANADSVGAFKETWQCDFVKNTLLAYQDEEASTFADQDLAKILVAEESQRRLKVVRNQHIVDLTTLYSGSESATKIFHSILSGDELCSDLINSRLQRILKYSKDNEKFKGFVEKVMAQFADVEEEGRNEALIRFLNYVSCSLRFLETSEGALLHALDLFKEEPKVRWGILLEFSAGFVGESKAVIRAINKGENTDNAAKKALCNACFHRFLVKTHEQLIAEDAVKYEVTYKSFIKYYLDEPASSQKKTVEEELFLTLLGGLEEFSGLNTGYTVGSFLGKGTFGFALKVFRDESEGREEKVLKISCGTSEGYNLSDEAKRGNKVRGEGTFEVLNHEMLLMPLVAGKTVCDTLSAEDGPASVLTALRVFRGMAQELKRLHDGGYVHNDLNNCNVMVADPDADEVKVTAIDFARSQAIGIDPIETLFSFGDRLGDRYVAPEAYAKRARSGAVYADPVHPSVDAYAMLYWLTVYDETFDSGFYYTFSLFDRYSAKGSDGNIYNHNRAFEKKAWERPSVVEIEKALGKDIAFVQRLTATTTTEARAEGSNPSQPQLTEDAKQLRAALCYLKGLGLIDLYANKLQPRSEFLRVLSHCSDKEVPLNAYHVGQLFYDEELRQDVLQAEAEGIRRVLTSSVADFGSYGQAVAKNQLFCQFLCLAKSRDLSFNFKNAWSTRNELSVLMKAGIEFSQGLLDALLAVTQDDEVEGCFSLGAQAISDNMRSIHKKVAIRFLCTLHRELEDYELIGLIKFVLQDENFAQLIYQHSLSIKKTQAYLNGQRKSISSDTEHYQLKYKSFMHYKNEYSAEVVRATSKILRDNFTVPKQRSEALETYKNRVYAAEKKFRKQATGRYQTGYGWQYLRAGLFTLCYLVTRLVIGYFVRSYNQRSFWRGKHPTTATTLRRGRLALDDAVSACVTVRNR